MNSKRFVQMFGYYVSLEDVVAFEERDGATNVYTTGGHVLRLNATMEEIFERLAATGEFDVRRT